MPLHVSRIQALCFDVDGTLSDTDDVMTARFAKLLRPFGFLFPGQDLEHLARRLVMASEAPANFLIGIPDLIGMDDEIFALVDWLARKSHRNPRHYQIIPDVRQTLAALSQRYPMAVVSARDTRTTMLFLEQFELTPYFQCIATAQTCKHTKPFPDPVLWAAEQLAVQPENCLMIGDTTVDIRAGKTAGTQTVGVLCGFGEELELRQHGADMILTTTSELMQVLEED
ncbi:MAG: HAD family hydrolase [Anaerolineales bacterium]|nr:HAD family hydrolase [Anaerolineales bacterium]